MNPSGFYVDPEQLQDILILFAIIFQIYHHDNTLIDIKTEKGSINH